MPELHFGRGDWDEALALLDDLIAEAQASGGHVLESVALITRSRIRLARGSSAAAVDDAARALHSGGRVGDPQALIPALANMVWVRGEIGPESEFSQLTEELLSLPHVGRHVGVDTVALLLDRGRREEVQGLIERMPDGPIRRAAAHVVGGRYREAVSLMLELEDEPTAAYLRLHAARQLMREQRAEEAEEELTAAIAFWQKVGATYFVGKATELLANRPDRLAPTENRVARA